MVDRTDDNVAAAGQGGGDDEHQDQASHDLVIAARD
jgi:hypothetical protein